LSLLLFSKLKKEMCITLAAIHVEAFVAEDTCELYQTVTAIK
jgi:hypothetical protein